MDQQMEFASLMPHPECTTLSRRIWRSNAGRNLKQQLREASFLGNFTGAIISSLEPGEICATGARLLYDFIRYFSITMDFSPELRMRNVTFSPGERRVTVLRGGKEQQWLEFMGDDYTLNQEHQGEQGGDPQYQRYVIELKDELGKIIIYVKERQVRLFSPTLLNTVVDIFSRSIKKSLEHTKIKELALRDGLTGLYNRRAFNEKLKTTRWQPSKTLSLMIIDIDDFKRLNDSFGHPAGDHVLTTFGGILQEGCRASDFVARFGGEEFVVLLPITRPSAAVQIADRLLAKLGEVSFTFNDQEVKVTASVGLAFANGKSNSVLDLVQRADTALYRAKKRGKNTTCIYPIREASTRSKHLASAHMQFSLLDEREHEGNA